MHILRSLLGAIAGFGLLTQPAGAHSANRKPLNHVTRIDDADIQTPSHRVNAFSSFEVTFSIHDRQEQVRLSLHPNEDILAENAAIHHMAPDGSIARTEYIDRSNHRVFRGQSFVRRKGRSEWTHAGWARITVRKDGKKPLFEGAFRAHGDNHHIQTSIKYQQTKLAEDPEIDPEEELFMVLWRDSDIRQNPVSHSELKRDLSSRSAGLSCSSDSLAFNSALEHPVLSGRSLDPGTSLATTSARFLFGREIDGTMGGNGAGVNLASSIGSTDGCPSTRKVALVGIATDCTYTKALGSKQEASDNIIAQVNTASQLFESTFSISLGIQNLTVNEEDCPATPPSSAPWNIPCSGSVSITKRLNLFSEWRGKFDDTNAYWTLLTTCGTDAAVGLAWLGQVCINGAQANSNQDGNETVASANVVVRTGSEWQVFAHESGHTFGAVHDCTSTTCSNGDVTKQRCCPLSKNSCDAKGRFIMNPSTGEDIEEFSPCSIGNVCSALKRNSVKSSCLTDNRNVKTVTASQCGNGIVERGEDCDCGGEAGCDDNPCCDAKTCKFKGSAVCDFSNEDCCTDQCQFSSQGTVCRPSTGVCDPEEVCSGTAPNCPADKNSKDGEDCGDGLECASGQCTSRDLQCKTLMGALTTNNDTHSCNRQGCQLSCASPEFGINTCLTMQQNFLDGTPCQGGGKCSNGQCKGSEVIKEIGNWIEDNKNIVIPVASVVGGLLLISIICCVTTSCRRRRRRNKVPKGGPPPVAQNPGWGGRGGQWRPQDPAGSAVRSRSRSRTRGPGRGRNDVSSHAAPPGPYHPQQWAPTRGMSERYA